MAIAQQTILRAARLEAGLFTACLNWWLGAAGEPVQPPPPESPGDATPRPTPAHHRSFGLARGFHTYTRESPSFALLPRYQAQAQRMYRRAVEEFERLRAGRGPARPDPRAPARTESPKEADSASQPQQNEPVPPPKTNPVPPPAALAVKPAIAPAAGARSPLAPPPSRAPRFSAILKSEGFPIAIP